MRCCVPGCENDSELLSKTYKAFLPFPSNKSVRSTWLRVINKSDWKPNAGSVICSDHFSEEDLILNKRGVCKLRAGAVPMTSQDFVSCDPHAVLNVCRICLATDCRMYLMNKYELCEAYQALTGLQIEEEDKFPKMLCVQCACKLTDCNKFRNKCLRANSLMLDILNEDKTLTLKLIKLINREENNLTSDISLSTIHHHNSDGNDIKEDKYENTQEAIPTTKEGSGIPSAENGKEEIEVCVKNEDNFEEFPDDNDVVVIDGDVNSEDSLKFHYSKANNDDDDCYSSSDSLPLKLCKTGKKRKLKNNTGSPAKKVGRRKKIVKSDEPKVDKRRKPLMNADWSDNLFTVVNLTLEEQINDVLKRQETSNYKNSHHKCDQCFKGFIDLVAYNTHMRKHSNLNGAFECEICKTHFKKSHALRKHITAHHTQRYSCNQCVYETTHRQSARLHEKWHKGTQYECPHCYEVFQKFTTYMGHVRIKHPSDFVCQLCGFSFVSQKGIELHKSLKHNFNKHEQVKDDGPLCEPCNIRFISTEAYNKHLEVSARHKTPSDRKRNENSDITKKVMKTYYSEKRRPPSKDPIPCEQCGIQLPDNRAYHSHFRKSHPDKNRTNYPSMKAPCMCEVCGKLFQSQALLKDHGWVHTSQLPFKCEICGKQFRMRQRLVTHKKFEDNTFKSYYFSDSPDPENAEDSLVIDIKNKILKRTTNNIDVFFEKSKRHKKVPQQSSSVSTSRDNGVSYITSNENESNATHLIKIEVYEMKKINNIAPINHWKHADVRVKYYVQSESDKNYQSTRDVIYNITKQVAATRDCSKYLIESKQEEK